MNVDLGSLKETLSAVNSAMRVNSIAEEMAHGERVAAAIARESAKRDATLVAGAEASIEQKEILQQQLEMIREQNMFLCDNYEKLKEMYETWKQRKECEYTFIYSLAFVISVPYHTFSA